MIPGLSAGSPSRLSTWLNRHHNPGIHQLLPIRKIAHGCCHVNWPRLEVDIAVFDHARFAADPSHIATPGQTLSVSGQTMPLRWRLEICSHDLSNPILNNLAMQTDKFRPIRVR